MKKIVMLLSACLLLTIPAVASAACTYVGANVGVAIVPDGSLGSNMTVTYNNGYTASGVVGYSYDSGFRIEGELLGKGYDTDKVSYPTLSSSFDSTINIVALMANFYYDFNFATSYGITPYVGVGVGAAEVYVSAANSNLLSISSSNETVLAYQAGGGFLYKINKNWSLDLGYRYFHTQDVQLDVFFQTRPSLTIDTHNVTIGAHYLF